MRQKKRCSQKTVWRLELTKLTKGRALATGILGGAGSMFAPSLSGVWPAVGTPASSTRKMPTATKTRRCPKDELGRDNNAA